MYTVEPADHWRVGDRAYCIRGLRASGRQVLERGRVYSVVAVLQMRGMMSDGLHLEGVERGGSDGFWSSRFVCLRGRDLPIRQVAERTRHKWLDAYWATAAIRNPDSKALQALAAGTRSDETLQAAQSEGCQSGGKAVTPKSLGQGKG